MKTKFSLLCATILTALSASAFDAPAIGNAAQMFGSFKANRSADAPNKAPASNMEELTGEYICSCYDYSLEEMPIITFQIDIAQGSNENEIIVTGLCDIPLPIVCKVEFETGVIYIKNQKLEGTIPGDNPDETYEVHLQHAAWVDDGTGSGSQIAGETDIDLQAFIVDGGIVFGYPNDIIAMKAYKGDTFVRTISSVSYTVASPVYVDPYTYEPIEGKATFEDGWILPALKVVPSTYPMEVVVERCVEKPGQYRIVDPYKNEIYADVNEGTDDPGYIVFDISNPECVIVLTDYRSGFYQKESWQLGHLYLFNLEGLILYDYEALGKAITSAEIKEEMNKAGYECSTYVDGVTTIKNCLFGYDANPMAGAFWQNIDIEMTSKLTFPKGFDSVTDVEIENNEPVEYFNLQGIKVENPQNGLYIRRQGKTAEKVYIL